MNKKIFPLLIANIINIQARLPEEILDKATKAPLNSDEETFNENELCMVRDDIIYQNLPTQLNDKQIETLKQLITDGSNLKQKIARCYAFSQLFAIDDREENMLLFLIAVYAVLEATGDCNELRNNLKNQISAIIDNDVVSTLVNLLIQKREEIKCSQVCKALICLYKNDKMIISNAAIYLIREWPDFMDTFNPIKDETQFMEYISLVLADKRLKSPLKYSDNLTGISIAYSDNKSIITAIVDKSQLTQIFKDHNSQDMQLCVEICTYIYKTTGHSFEFDISSIKSPRAKAFLLLVYTKLFLKGDCDDIKFSNMFLSKKSIKDYFGQDMPDKLTKLTTSANMLVIAAAPSGGWGWKTITIIVFLCILVLLIIYLFSLNFSFCY